MTVSCSHQNLFVNKSVPTFAVVDNLHTEYYEIPICNYVSYFTTPSALLTHSFMQRPYILICHVSVNRNILAVTLDISRVQNNLANTKFHCASPCFVKQCYVRNINCEAKIQCRSL